MTDTHAFTGQIELLSLQLRENFEELLHKTNQLRSEIIFVLTRPISERKDNARLLEKLTLRFGVPCENPVPTGCSTHNTLDRLVQLNSLGVGLA